MDSIQDEAECFIWADEGYYGYVDPLSQFEFDDDLAKARRSTPWPISYILAKWRPVMHDLWRRLRNVR